MLIFIQFITQLPWIVIEQYLGNQFGISSFLFVLEVKTIIGPNYKGEGVNYTATFHSDIKNTEIDIK